METRICKRCGTPFLPKHGPQMYCDGCKEEHKKDQGLGTTERMDTRKDLAAFPEEYRKKLANGRKQLNKDIKGANRKHMSYGQYMAWKKDHPNG